MPNLKQIAEETGYHQSTIKKVVDELGFSLNVVGGEHGGWSYMLDDQCVEEIKQHLSKTRKPPGFSGGLRRPCPVCGERGHTPTRCPDSPENARCSICKRSLPRSSFRTIMRSMPNGTKARVISSSCIECDADRLRKRYRSSYIQRLDALLRSVIARSREKDIPCDIDLEYLQKQLERQDQKCYYSGLPLSLDVGDEAISIDRIIPVNGYVKGNVVFVTWAINQMKRDHTVAYFVDLCNRVSKLHGG